MLSIKQLQTKFWPQGSQSIQSLLAQHDYVHAAELLLAAHEQAEKQNDVGLAGYLLAVYHICLSCHQHQKDIVTYYEGHKTAVQRHADLQKQLHSLLTILGEEKPVNLPSHPQMQPDNIQSISQPTSTASTAASLAKSATPQQPKRVQTPTLAVHLLGTFQVFKDDHPIESWSNGKGKLLFKYLIIHRQRPIGKEILMDLFWPDATPDAARNNLNVAIYGLRKILRNRSSDFSHILFQDNCYLLNPEIQVWVDSEQFTAYVQSAHNLAQQNHHLQAIAEYHKAEELYQGNFLDEDPYEEWLMPQRQRLQHSYLTLLDYLSNAYFSNQDYATCISMCHKILTYESCHEETHRQLMRAYCHQNQHFLALRHYHHCLKTFKDELNMPPDPATTELYEKIRRREPI